MSCDFPTIAQHRHAIGQPEDLIQAMSYQHDSRALITEPGEDVEQATHIGLWQRRRRLIQDEDVSPQGERPRNGND
jgi:hypothetical protein